MSDLSTYIQALFTHWWAYMTAGPFVADEVAKLVSPRWKQFRGAGSPGMRRRVELALLTIGFLYANFACWSDERHAEVAAKQEAGNARHEADDAKAKLAASAPEVVSAEVLRLRREIRALRDPPEEWPPLPADQVSEWVSQLGALPQARKPWVIYDDGNSAKLRVSIDQVFGRLHFGACKSSIGDGRITGIRVHAQESDPSAQVLFALLRSGGYDPTFDAIKENVATFELEIGSRPIAASDGDVTPNDARNAGKSLPEGTSR